MAPKTIAYRLLRLGRIRPRRRYQLESEDVQVLDEGVRVGIIYRHYKAPGKRILYRRAVGSGAVVVTHKRLAVFFYGRPVIDLPLSDERIAALAFTAERSPKGRPSLRISFDAADLDPKCSGHVALFIRTNRAEDLVRTLGRAGS